MFQPFRLKSPAEAILGITSQVSTMEIEPTGSSSAASDDAAPTVLNRWRKIRVTNLETPGTGPRGQDPEVAYFHDSKLFRVREPDTPPPDIPIVWDKSAQQLQKEQDLYNAAAAQTQTRGQLSTIQQTMWNRQYSTEERAARNMSFTLAPIIEETKPTPAAADAAAGPPAPPPLPLPAEPAAPPVPPRTTVSTAAVPLTPEGKPYGSAPITKDDPVLQKLVYGKAAGPTPPKEATTTSTSETTSAQGTHRGYANT